MLTFSITSMLESHRQCKKLSTPKGNEGNYRIQFNLNWKLNLITSLNGMIALGEYPYNRRN